jgi:hypothetical protein
MNYEKRRDDTATRVDLEHPILGFTWLEFTGHAIAQMKIRRITIKDVITTLESPSATDLPTQDGRKRYRRNKTFALAIDVVFEEWTDRITIITAIAVTRRIVERKKNPNGKS